MTIESQSRHSTRISSLQTLPSLPSGRQVTYDQHRISDYNEFGNGIDIDEEELDDGYNGEDEGKYTGMFRRESNEGEDVDMYRGDMVDIEIDEHERQIEMNLDDDENEDLEPNFTADVPIQLTGTQGEDQSIHLSDDESKASRVSFSSFSRKSNRSTRSKSTNDSIEIFNFPLSNEEHQISINELLNDGHEKLDHDMQFPKRQSNNTEERSHQFSQAETRSQHNREVSPLSHEKTESQWHSEEQTPRNSMKPTKPQKHLTPAKKRRRCILGIFLLSFCLSTAGAGVWFVFYYLEDKRGYNTSEIEESVDEEVAQPPPFIQPIGDIFDSDCAPLTVEIKIDSFGNETSWTLVYLLGESSSGLTQDDNVYFERRRFVDDFERKRLRQHRIGRELQQSQELAVGSGGPYSYLDNTTQQLASPPYSSTYCLTKGSYKFGIRDDNGDGICCKYGQGYFRLYFTRGGREIHSSSFEFGREEDIVFDVTDRDIDTAQKTDVPSISLMPSTSYSPSIAQSISNTSITSSPTNPDKSMSTASGTDILANVSKSYGIIFDIRTHRNTSSVLIVGIEVLVHSTDAINYEVWTMSGSWRDINTNETAFHSGFEKIANGTFVGMGVCYDCGFTPIPNDAFDSVFVEGSKAAQSFWVSLSADSLVFKNAEVPASSCDSFVVENGAAVLVSSVDDADTVFDLSDGKGFLGMVHYQVKFRDVIGTDSPTPSSTVPLLPTSRPPSNATNSSFVTASSYYPTHTPSINTTYDSTILLENAAFEVDNVTPAPLAPSITTSSISSQLALSISSTSSGASSNSYAPALSLYPTPTPSINVTSDSAILLQNATFEVDNVTPSPLAPSITTSPNSPQLTAGNATNVT